LQATDPECPGVLRKLVSQARRIVAFRALAVLGLEISYLNAKPNSQSTIVPGKADVIPVLPGQPISLRAIAPDRQPSDGLKLVWSGSDGLTVVDSLSATMEPPTGGQATITVSMQACTTRQVPKHPDFSVMLRTMSPQLVIQVKTDQSQRDIHVDPFASERIALGYSPKATYRARLDFSGLIEEAKAKLGMSEAEARDAFVPKSVEFAVRDAAGQEPGGAADSNP